ncbi:MAG: hypothetical protein AVDCRST_MAG67-1675 [uncultured Solirubrobacteraceae bacterium]|uniref:Uncharacterized protein n=1 Tax=uncultured Solirubrobacteraceae bacterium TaxID=1162706 RepID=A0A6J4SFQ3_9ACTN|nr:MAG: hypothetical protein AVDCRST_MAG67-1675 [uncultured Solirubrobacteraceae bacterium]
MVALVLGHELVAALAFVVWTDPERRAIRHGVAAVVRLPSGRTTFKSSAAQRSRRVECGDRNLRVTTHPRPADSRLTLTRA